MSFSVLTKRGQVPTQLTPSKVPVQAKRRQSSAGGSLRDDRCTESGDLALKELPTPPLSWDWDLGGWNLYLGTLSFLVMTENNIPLVEIYRNIVTWLWSDFKNKGSDPKKFATTHHTPPSYFALKGLCRKLSVTLGVLRAWPSPSMAL